MSRFRSGHFQSAFTLVELLVVIAIIGVLVALLLPAVQAAREAARRLQCSNHLKQMGLAFQNHHDTYLALPSGGNIIDGPRSLTNGVPAILNAQNWGWAYQILPFLEQQPLYSNLDDDKVRGTAIKMYSCPTRRPPQIWDINGGGSVGKRAQLDYAGCRGSTNDGIDGMVARATAAILPTRFQHATDGLSNTMLAGERGWPVDWYLKPGGSENNWYRGGFITGYDTLHRSRYALTGTNGPLVDGRGPFPNFAAQEYITVRFGSAHPAGFNALLCDGSVRNVAYHVSGAVFLNFAKRDDGNPFSPGDLQ